MLSCVKSKKSLKEIVLGIEDDVVDCTKHCVHAMAKIICTLDRRPRMLGLESLSLDLFFLTKNISWNIYTKEMNYVINYLFPATLKNLFPNKFKKK